MEIRQYDIVLVNLEPTIGKEIHKTRPCVVISPNEINKNLAIVVVAPMTTQSKAYPTRVEVNHDGKQGWIVVDQIRAIDRQRILKVLDKLARKEIHRLKKVIQETYVD